MSRSILAGTLLAAFALSPAARAQSTDNSQDKPFDVRSSVGDMHIGGDADPSKIGLPLYPGARLKNDDENKGNKVNMGVSMEAFGFF